MPEFWGSDTAAVREHAGRTARGGTALDEIGERLRSVVGAVGWVGPDAETFRARAAHEGSIAIAEAAARVARFAEDLFQEADEQDAASAPDGGGRTGPVDSDSDDNKFWFWQDGFAPLWGSTADLQDDIPLDVEEFTADSISQEGKGNCVAVSLLGAIANADPEFLAEHIRRVGPEQYEVDLFIDGEWRTVAVQGDVDKDGVRGPDGNQTWATVYEQALIQEGVLGEDGGYANNRHAAEVLTAVTGGGFEYGQDGNHGREEMPSYSDVVREVERGRPVVLGTENNERSANGVEIVEKHAYIVESVNPDGSLTLVNPWGEDVNYSSDDGEHRITITAQEYHQLFDSSVIGKSPEHWER